MDLNYPELWKVAQKIEGLICRVGEHAGGVIFVDEPFTESTALMKVPNGDIVTQFDLHDSEDVSLIKIDALSVEAADKIHTCIDLLCEHGYAERKATLRETYESIVGVYNLERDAPEMWDMVLEHKIQSLFQMEKQSGINGIALAKPRSVDELAVLNSVIRLMASEKGAEQPLEMWARYRKDINQWYNEMREFGLNKEEIEWLAHHPAIHNGITESQESLMALVQEERLGGNDLTFADSCRKAIAKKQGKLFEECEKKFFENIKNKNLSYKLADYVWNVLFKVQRGYSFNASHTHAYSLVALQEMNLCYRFPIIFWNTACLITDSGSEGSGTDYNKIASAIGKMINAGIKVSLIDINKSSYNFEPIVENNTILFGLKAIQGLGDDIVQKIISNRPYSSPRDFINKISPNRSVMISLIKSGAFDNMMDRKLCMAWYIWETCDKKSRLTLQNLPSLMSHNMLPEDSEERVMARRIYEFNRYLKALNKNIPNKPYYIIDDRASAFLCEIDKDDIICYNGNLVCILKSDWEKIYQNWMDVFRNWINEDKDNILKNLNGLIFKADWDKYAKGNISAWEMEALCFYFHEHELKNANIQKYGIVPYNMIPEEPVVERVFEKGGHEIKIFQLYKICGTCIAKNKAKHSVSLLTTSGIVEVKFAKEHFSLFDKQISVKNPDGTKSIVEKSWFNRGSLIVVKGIRTEDGFRAKNYNSSSGHQLYKIDAIESNGDMILRSERVKGDLEDE